MCLYALNEIRWSGATIDRSVMASYIIPLPCALTRLHLEFVITRQMPDQARSASSLGIFITI